MEYLVIGLCLIALIVAGVMIYLHKMKNDAKDPSALDTVTAPASNSEDELILPAQDEPQEISIPVEMLPAEVIPVGAKLVEIKDRKVLAHIDQLVPHLAQAGNALNNAVQAAQANGEVCTEQSFRLEPSLPIQETWLELSVAFIMALTQSGAC